MVTVIMMLTMLGQVKVHSYVKRMWIKSVLLSSSWNTRTKIHRRNILPNFLSLYIIYMFPVSHDFWDSVIVPHTPDISRSLTWSQLGQNLQYVSQLSLRSSDYLLHDLLFLFFFFFFILITLIIITIIWRIICKGWTLTDTRVFLSVLLYCRCPML